MAKMIIFELYHQLIVYGPDYEETFFGNGLSKEAAEM